MIIASSQTCVEKVHEAKNSKWIDFVTFFDICLVCLKYMHIQYTFYDNIYMYVPIDGWRHKDEVRPHQILNQWQWYCSSLVYTHQLRLTELMGVRRVDILNMKYIEAWIYMRATCTNKQQDVCTCTCVMYICVYFLEHCRVQTGQFKPLRHIKTVMASWSSYS